MAKSNAIGVFFLILIGCFLIFIPRQKEYNYNYKEIATPNFLIPALPSIESPCMEAIKIKKKLLKELKIPVPDYLLAKLTDCLSIPLFDKELAGLLHEMPEGLSVLTFPGKKYNTADGIILHINTLVAQQLKKLGFMPIDLNKNVFDIRALRIVYSLDDFYTSDYTFDELFSYQKNALIPMFNVVDILESKNYSIDALLHSGLDPYLIYKAFNVKYHKDLIEIMYGKTQQYNETVKELLQKVQPLKANFKKVFRVEKLINSSLSLKQLIKLGYRYDDFHYAGITALHLVAMGVKADTFRKLGIIDPLDFLEKYPYDGMNYEILTKIGYSMSRPPLGMLVGSQFLELMNPFEGKRFDLTTAKEIMFYYTREEIDTFYDGLFSVLNGVLVGAGTILGIGAVGVAVPALVSGIATVETASVVAPLASFITLFDKIPKP
ncbi:hypothetical protein [Candidatus Phytoplasma solani]|uniref:hypothetical protein n=2 Tax=Candidatus Phytoplasma solani TaxID=69896 RepID=UPI00358E501B